MSETTGTTALHQAWRKSWRKWRAILDVVSRFAPYKRGRVRTMAFALLAALGYAGMRILEPWPIKLIIDNVLLGYPPQAFRELLYFRFLLANALFLPFTTVRTFSLGALS